MRLDLARGSAERPGLFGVDIAATPRVDLVFDRTRAPWPFAGASVDEVHCAHSFEHLTGDQRVDFEVGRTLAAEWQHHSEQERLGAIRHPWNVASEMTVCPTRC